MIRLPPRPAIWSTFRVTLMTWIVLRGLVGFASGSPAILFSASVFLVLGVAVVALVDSSVARERLFYENLGVGRRMIAGMAVGFACGLEVASALILSFLG